MMEKVRCWRIYKEKKIYFPDIKNLSYFLNFPTCFLACDNAFVLCLEVLNFAGST